MWTNAGPAELLSAVAELFDTIPSPPSHVLWYPWREQKLPEAAISVQGSLYLAAFAGWTDPAQDAQIGLAGRPDAAIGAALARDPAG